jgi:hypothetical protein
MDSWKDEDFERMRKEGATMFDNSRDEIMGQIKIVLE